MDNCSIRQILPHFRILRTIIIVNTLLNLNSRIYNSNQILPQHKHLKQNEQQIRQFNVHPLNFPYVGTESTDFLGVYPKNPQTTLENLVPNTNYTLQRPICIIGPNKSAKFKTPSSETNKKARAMACAKYAPHL